MIWILWILSQFRIFSTLSRVLGSEDTEDAEAAAARPVVPPETADTCSSSVSDTSTCGVRTSGHNPRIRDSRRCSIVQIRYDSCNKTYDMMIIIIYYLLSKGISELAQSAEDITSTSIFGKLQ